MKVLRWFGDLSSSTSVLFVLALYLLLSLPLLLTWPAPMIDEALFGSTAKTFVDQGHLGTTLVKGLESRAYWQPPFYFLAVGPAIKIIGYNLATMRVCSVLTGAGLIILVFVLGLRFADAATAKIAALILAIDPHFVNNVKFARMDGLCMLFILIALAMEMKPLFQHKPANDLIIGVLAAFAALTHPFGAIVAIVLAVHVVGRPSMTARERLTEVSRLLFPLMIAAFLYGLWILQDVNAFGEQMSYQLARKDRPLFLTIVNTVKHYRHDPLALAMPVVSLAFLFPQAMRQRGNVWLLVLCLGALMVTAISQFETPYHVYIAPLGAGATAMLLVALWNSSSRMKRSTAIICIGALLLNSVSVFSYLNFVVHTPVTGKTGYDQLCQSISDHVPAGARLCGWGTPCVYWGLNEHRPDIAFTDPEFLDSIRANEVARGIDYVVLSRAFVPTEDETALTRQRNRLSELCARNGRALKAVAMVGQKEEYSYSAEVFQVISLAGQ